MSDNYALFFNEWPGEFSPPESKNASALSEARMQDFSPLGELVKTNPQSQFVALEPTHFPKLSLKAGSDSSDLGESLQEKLIARRKGEL